MDHLSRKLIVASLLLLVLLPVGIASAVTSVTHTNLTIHRKPTGDVAAGTAVTIYGRLHSSAQVCRSGQTIHLIIGSSVAATAVTDAQGRYTFIAQTVNSDSELRATFAGSLSGVHPNIRTCAGSTSRVLTIDVNGPGGGVLGTGGGANAVSGSGSAFTGADVLADLRLLAVLLICGLAAIFVARRSAGVGHSHGR